MCTYSVQIYKGAVSVRSNGWPMRIYINVLIGHFLDIRHTHHHHRPRFRFVALASSECVLVVIGPQFIHIVAHTLLALLMLSSDTTLRLVTAHVGIPTCSRPVTDYS